MLANIHQKIPAVNFPSEEIAAYALGLALDHAARPVRVTFEDIWLARLGLII